MDLTPEESKAIKALKRIAKTWPKTLWLFSADGTLHVMRTGPNGDRAHTSGDYIDPLYTVGQIDIPNDGGVW